MSGFSHPDTMPTKPLVGAEWPDLMAFAGLDIIYGTKIIVVIFLRWLFQEAFHGIKWNLDDDVSDIIIGDKHQSYAKAIHKKPRIIIDRGSIQWDNISFNKTLGSGSRAVPVYQDGIQVGYSTAPLFGGRPGLFGSGASVPGSNVMVDTISGTFTILCYAEEGLMAERIASFVFLAIRTHRDKLRQMGFFEIDSSGVGREAPEFGTSNYRLVGVPVLVKFKAFITVEMEQLVDVASDCGTFERLKLGTMVIPSPNACGSGS